MCGTIFVCVLLERLFARCEISFTDAQPLQLMRHFASRYEFKCHILNVGIAIIHLLQDQGNFIHFMQPCGAFIH